MLTPLVYTAVLAIHRYTHIGLSTGDQAAARYRVRPRYRGFIPKGDRVLSYNIIVVPKPP